MNTGKYKKVLNTNVSRHYGSWNIYNFSSNQGGGQKTL